MTLRLLPRFTLSVVALCAAPALVHAQAAEEPPKSFDRKYIDASSYRADQTLLHDWPELTRLVVWSRGVEGAVAEADRTLSADLLAEFRARVDSLRGAPVPGFLGTHADSVGAALGRLAGNLAQAEASLAAIPDAIVTPRGGIVSGGASNQRTLVTGGTAVTVPAGVAVGSERDSLPAVSFQTGETVTFVDRIALALLELDKVVHFTRRAGSAASRSPGSTGATPAPGSTPPPPGP